MMETDRLKDKGGELTFTSKKLDSLLDCVDNMNTFIPQYIQAIAEAIDRVEEEVRQLRQELQSQQEKS